MSANNGLAQNKKTVPKKNVAASNKSSKVMLAKVKPGPICIRITTDSGVMVIKLSDSTPLHRNNFVKLVKEGFYDSLLFHRVIPQFMIQGGDPTSKYAATGERLGNGGDTMARIPAEFNPSLYHKKGVLAAARDGNPAKASSACQFYLVEGKIFTDEQLNMLEQQKGFKYTLEQREMYKTVGGTAHLDGAYTVFGEVETGLEVISKIAGVPKDAANRPLGDIRMKMEIIK
ncbi:MAG TPA: peptidylprolyl isomerase [Ferruginibacter sp.]|nr:peptidylprolyl isomerase [Ferruginibacter sp.]